KDSLKQSVILAYLDVLKAQELLKIRKQHLGNFKKLEELAKLRFEFKETGKSDVLRVQTNLGKAKIEVINAFNTLSQSRISLNTLLQFPPYTVLKLEDKLFTQDQIDQSIKEINTSQTNIPKIHQNLVQKSWNYSISLQLAQAEIRGIQLEKNQIRSKFQPKVQATASWFHQLYYEQGTFASDSAEETYQNGNKTGWSAGISISIPIYEGGSKFKKLTTLEIQLADRKARIQKTKANLAQNIQSFHTKYLSAQDLVQKNKILLKIAKETLDLGKISYKEGSIPIMDLLDLQSTVILSEIGVSSNRFQLVQSLAQTLNLVGKIDLMKQSLSKKSTIQFFESLQK
ncbi:MAG: outer membrane protein, partial [bacterium]